MQIYCHSIKALKFYFELEQSAYYHAAPLLKVSTLQYWLGKPYTDGYLTKGLEVLPHCARLFLFQSNETSENIEAKSAEVPNSAASDSQKFFSNTFKADKEVHNIELDLEIFIARREERSERLKCVYQKKMQIWKK